MTLLKEAGMIQKHWYFTTIIYTLHIDCLSTYNLVYYIKSWYYVDTISTGCNSGEFEISKGKYAWSHIPLLLVKRSW